MLCLGVMQLQCCFSFFLEQCQGDKKMVKNSRSLFSSLCCYRKCNEHANAGKNTVSEFSFDKARNRALLQEYNGYCNAENLSENAEYQEHSVKSLL